MLIIPSSWGSQLGASTWHHQTAIKYADDTILFIEHYLAKAIKMKLILCLFEQ
jgi:hypothetical protein